MLIFTVRSVLFTVLGWCSQHPHVAGIVSDYLFLGLVRRQVFTMLTDFF